jgi:hypothetical protein
MIAVNTRRVLLGALAGGVVWGIWSTVVNVFFLGARYQAAEKVGTLLLEPRGIPVPVFMSLWYVTLFVLSFIVCWFYASGRATRGAGPGPAIQVGAFVGFAAGFPVNISVASWGTFGRGIPFFWGLDMFIGAILAALVGGWLYKD